jgi:hypothetical protein
MSINVINRIYLGQIGRVPVIEQHEKLSYLNEHISYEVIMLNYTFMRVMTFKASTAEDELERNAFLEAFGVHAGRMIETRRTTSRPLSPMMESRSNRRSYGSKSKFFALQRFKKLILEANLMSTMPANSMHGLFQQSSNFRGRSALRIAQN